MSSSLVPTQQSLQLEAQGKTVPARYADTILQDDWDAMPESERLQALLWLGDREADTTAGTMAELPVIRFPTSGASGFEIPTPDAVPKLVAHFNAVVVAKMPGRGVWLPLDRDPVEGTLPTCSSRDGVTPVAPSTDEQRQAGAPFAKVCSDCQYNAWGSGKNGEGKGCRERLRLVLRLDGAEIPFVLSLPPTSLKPFGAYAVGVRNAKIPGGLNGSLTTFSLVEATNKRGVKYKEIVCTLASKLSYRDMMAAEELRKAFAAVIDRMGITVTETQVDPAAEGVGGDPSKIVDATTIPY